MAEFQEVMKDWKRMCEAMGQEDEYTACDKCDLRDFGCPAIYENECSNADWNHVESVVVAWATEHPGPVYPTWVEWLVKIGVIPHEIRLETADALMDTQLLKSIPADIAQKLGVEPKEGA